MMLALMLHYPIVAGKASCHTMSKDFLKSMKTSVEILLRLQVFLAEYLEIEYLFGAAPSRPETSLLFCNGLFCLWLESV